LLVLNLELVRSRMVGGQMLMMDPRANNAWLGSSDSSRERAPRVQTNDSNGKPLSMTVVTCMESGILEPLTLRMVDSLRRFGGRFANLEVVAVTPRATPPLAKQTQERMAELGIRHLRVHPKNPYAWHHYMNKAEAIVAVEQQVTTEAIAWVDSDIIFLSEPVHLALPPGIDFLASAPDTGMVGSTGMDNPNDRFWQRCSALIGKNADELPWLDTGDGQRIRFYWNAGLYVYRRASRFGTEFLSDFKRFLDQRVARTHYHVHAMDQVVLGLTVIRLGLAWKALPVSSNFPVCSFLPDNYDASKVTDVTVLHYHDSMSPKLWPLLLTTIAPAHPRIHAWLKPQGPVVVPSSSFQRVAREAFRLTRGLYRRAYYLRSGFTKNLEPE
jgi:hypothetical protein